MNNEFNSNMRTLIVSFAIAIMFLIPLRFVEVGNIMMSSVSTPQVLGESVVLPNAEVEAPLLEAPYNVTETNVLGARTSNCISPEAAMRSIEQYARILEVVKGNDLQTNQIVDSVLEVQKNTCK